MKSLVGFGLAWAGYLLMYFGWSSIQNKGYGLVQLAIKPPPAGA